MGEVDEVMFEIYKGKRVLVTGATGFKGSWLCLWLKQLEASICGYALSPNTQPSLFSVLQLEHQIRYIAGNILNRTQLEQTFNTFKPEVVFHLAAQPLVRLSYAEPVLTYETNVIGTLNVLEAARKCDSVLAFVNVTTDKCYENKEIARGYVESDPMGGYDMYSSSKGCTEILSSSYRRSFLADGFSLATARAGNVIGGGDWAQDRLLPDCARAISKGDIVEIRNPASVRPWQHVLEPLSGYLTLGERLLIDGHKYADAFNFGPCEESILTVAEVAKLFIQHYGAGELFVHKRDELHEASLLMLNIEKAQRALKWKPIFTADEAIQKTAEWYRFFYEGNAMQDYTLQQIKNYQDRSC